MLDKSNKNVILKIIGAAVVVFLVVLVVSSLFPSGPKSLDDIVKEINVNTVTHQKVPVDVQADLKDSLPEISKYPPQVNSSTPSYIEIFSSTEKAGSGTDGWLTEVAKDFNNAAIMIDGKQVSVTLRGMPSGQGADYITSG